MKLLLALLIGVFSFNVCRSAELSFEQALSQIVQRSTDIPQVQAELDAQEAAFLSSQLSFLPDLEANYSDSTGGTFSWRQKQASLQARLNLFRGGSDFYGYQTQKNQLKANQYGLLQEQLDVEKKASEVIFRYLLAARRLEIFQKLSETNQRSFQALSERVQRGLAPEQEALKAEIDWQNAQAQFLSAEVDHERARRNLEELLGHAEVRGDWPFEKVLLELKEASVQRMELSFEARPDVQAARYALESSEATYKRTFGQFLPRIDLSHSWARYGQDNFDNREQASLISVSFPFFEGGRSKLEVERAGAQRLIVRQQLVALRRQASIASKETLSSLLRLAETIKQRQKTVELAKRVFDNNFRRYQEGRTSVNELQIDQGRLLDSQLLASQGWFDAHLAFVHFCHAGGMGLSHCFQKLYGRN